MLTFLILRKVDMSGDFAIRCFHLSNTGYSWLAGLILCLVPVQHMLLPCLLKKIWIFFTGRTITYPRICGYIEIKCVRNIRINGSKIKSETIEWRWVFTNRKWRIQESINFMYHSNNDRKNKTTSGGTMYFG